MTLGKWRGCWSDAGLVALALLPLLTSALLPAIGVAIPRVIQWSLLAIAIIWLAVFVAAVLRNRVTKLHLLAAHMQGLREGEYGSRLRLRGGVIGDLAREFNALAAHIGGEERRGLETDALLSQLLAGLELAVVIVNQQDRLVDLNPAAEELLGNEPGALIGRDAAQLGLSDWLDRAAPFVDRRNFPAGEGPWEVRRIVFRRHGQPHRLLVVTDVSRALREEERRAWRRLIRVLGHEINNSLGSIQSTANVLKEHLPAADASTKEGLDLIDRRSRALGGFIRRYAELARLPPPTPESVDLSDVVRNVARMEDRVAITVETNTPATAYVDKMQFEQAFINLLHNAVDAALETGGTVRIRWYQQAGNVLLEIEDDGPGIAETENLFVPFFTTKPGGSGIGLVLARQIVEAHGGSLHLANRRQSRGALAIVRLPIERRF